MALELECLKELKATDMKTIQTKNTFKLRLACWILGEPITPVLLSGPAGEREILRRARSIMLPTFFYFGVGILIAMVELEKEWYVGLLVGAIMGYVILSLDRLILSSNSRFGKATRWVLTICLAFALSFIVEPFIFEDEMKAELREMENEAEDQTRSRLDADFNDKRIELVAVLEEARATEQGLRQEYFDEVDGGGGTGYRGVGEVARSKEKYLKKAEQKSFEAENALRDFDLDKNALLQNRLEERVSIVDKPGILRKSEAVIRVALSNGKAAALFLAITGILFFIEATVLMTKPKGIAPHEIVIKEDWETRLMDMELNKLDRDKLFQLESRFGKSA